MCQNQSIDESNADLAHHLRVLVRKRLLAGDTNQQVLDYVVARYGVFVLLDPPFDRRLGCCGWPAGAGAGRRRIAAVAGVLASARAPTRPS